MGFGRRTHRPGVPHLPGHSDENAGWIELEYLVDVRDAKPAFLALRALIQHRFPEEISPIQMRWTRGEPALSLHTTATTRARSQSRAFRSTIGAGSCARSMRHCSRGHRVRTGVRSVFSITSG